MESEDACSELITDLSDTHHYSATHIVSALHTTVELSTVPDAVPDAVHDASPSEHIKASSDHCFAIAMSEMPVPFN